MPIDEKLISGLFLDEDIEASVAKIMSQLKGPDGQVFELNKTKHERVERPIFKDIQQQKLWEREEIRRCIEGYDGMPGKHYFYFNYCRIKSVQGGMIRPEWRRVSRDSFDILERCLRGDLKGQGIITAKRRRIGWSWEYAASVLHEAMFYPFSEIGCQSKSETDIKLFFNTKVKFIYDNLELFLKASTGGGNSLLKMEFSEVEKDEKGNKRKVGTQSLIICKSPGDTSWEGLGLKLWLADEAGKTENILQTLSLTLPCLAGDDGITRHGVPVLGGTAGNIDEVGSDFKDIWNDAPAYDLIRIFIPGWAGLNTDEYGNEDVEGNVRWILTERRKKAALGQRQFFDHVQQYPLTPEEAFLSATSSPFDIPTINARLSELSRNPAKIQPGHFEFEIEDGEEVVVWKPHNDGKVHIFEHPQAGVDNQYGAGADPYDHVKKKNSGSQGAFYVYKRLYDIDEYGNMPVLQYIDQPEDPNAFYEQCAMACIYYDCKVLIERNRPGMLSYFTERDMHRYLKERPLKPNKVTVGTTIEYGVHMDESTKNLMIGKIDEYVRLNSGSIMFPELLEAMLIYDPDNQRKKKDEVDAFGITMLHMGDKNLRNMRESEEAPSYIPKNSFQMLNGKLVRMPKNGMF